MIKIINWHTDWASENMEGKYIVLFNRFAIAKGQWEGLMFDIQGLGKSKSEKLLGLEKVSKNITVYFLKWYFSYSKKGYENMLKNVTITSERVVI